MRKKSRPDVLRDDVRCASEASSVIHESGRPTSPAKPSKKVANSLVALSSLAVVAIYAAGYSKTRSAAKDLEAATQRRPVVPDPPASVNLSAAIAVDPLAPSVSSQVDVQLRSASPAATPAVASGSSASLRKPEKPLAKVSIAKDPSDVPPMSPSASTPEPPNVALPIAVPATVYRDGTYHGWGYSPHGDIYAFVVIEKGRIVHSGYDKCRTLWPCTLVDHLGPQVIQRQSAEVDYVSGATESGNAFYWGIVEALSKAKAEAEVPVEAKPQSSEPK